MSREPAGTTKETAEEMTSALAISRRRGLNSLPRQRRNLFHNVPTRRVLVAPTRFRLTCSNRSLNLRVIEGMTETAEEMTSAPAISRRRGLSSLPRQRRSLLYNVRTMRVLDAPTRLRLPCSNRGLSLRVIEGMTETAEEMTSAPAISRRRGLNSPLRQRRNLLHNVPHNVPTMRVLGAPIRLRLTCSNRGLNLRMKE